MKLRDLSSNLSLAGAETWATDNLGAQSSRVAGVDRIDALLAVWAPAWCVKCFRLFRLRNHVFFRVEARVH